MLRSVISAASILLTSLPLTASATTYYVSNHGDDHNNGTSPATPLQTLHLVNSLVYSPGDTILLERGSMWQGILIPCAAVQCSGTAASPIKIDAYGDPSAPLPSIDGVGSARATVSLVNQSYWEIRNLDVTNTVPAGSPFHYGGIEAICDSADPAKQACHHIYIGHNRVHDIHGQATYADNGIWVTWNLFEHANYWDDAVVEWNTIQNVFHHGIFASDNSPILTSINDTACPTQGFDCEATKPRTTHLTIRNNTLLNIGGDGIQFGDTDGARAEYNVLGNWGLTGAGPNASGIWSYGARNTIIQHNEVFGAQGTGDRTAFDLDFGNISTYIQYNYSHNNYGGMLLFFEQYDSTKPEATQNYIDDPIVKFNISLNDGVNGVGVVDIQDAHWGVGLNALDFANNTIHQSATNFLSGGPNAVEIFHINGPTPNDPSCHNSLITGRSHIYNNIFDIENSTTYPTFDASTIFEFNVFYSPHVTLCTPVPGGQVANVDGAPSTQNPMFVSFPADPASPADVRLKLGSPALGGGRYSTFLGTEDYFGNPVVPNVSPNRGAYNGPGL